MHSTRYERDWSIIDVIYPGKGVATTDDSFSCIDAFHQKDMQEDTWEETTIDVDEFQNCYIVNNEEGKSEIIEFEVDD